ncbi:high-temperature-induced dauer-formation protein-domain-containing protein [Schizophyllum fasciatum]
MFSRRLSVPFGLLPDEQKLRFRSEPGGIAKLAAVRHIPDSDPYWNDFFVLFDSPSDVFSLIAPNDIRRALLEAPENVATLLRVTVGRLNNLIADHTFPSSTAPSVAAFASSFMKTGSGLADRNTTKEALNCVRLLARVLPVVFDVEGESSIFETEVLWKRQEVETLDAPEASSSTQFVIDDEEDSDNESASQPHSPQKPRQLRQLPSLAEKLLDALFALLFCCGFTLPKEIQVDHHKISPMTWEKGVGATQDPGPSGPYESNRIEVLRLLLVLLSRQIYVPPPALFTSPSLFSLHLVQRRDRRDILVLLCSLLNTALNASSGHHGIGAMAARLPYNHLVMKGEDTRSNLAMLCLQVLCALLDFQSGTARDKTKGTEESRTTAPTARTNAFRYFLMKLHRTQDLTFILDGFLNAMEQQMTSANNILPGARKSIPYIPEMIILFWKITELNKKFRLFVLESGKCNDVMAHLACYLLELKDKPQQHGMCRTLSYILQTLSAEPAFGARLQAPVRMQLPAKYQVPGNAADFLINAVYSAISTTSGQLNSLYPALVIALANASPFFKNLTVTSATRLVQLVASFANPTFLLSDEGHPRLLFFMLEVFNGIIFHQLSDNAHLLYALLQAHQTFEDLATFTLARGLREIRRVQRAKEDLQRRRGSRDSLGHSRTDSAARGRAPRTPEANISRSGTPDSVEKGRSLDSARLMEEGAAHGPSDAESVPRSQRRSEKARGKMKERSPEDEMDESLERIAAAGVGRNGFVPTQDWVASWQTGLQLDPILVLIAELLPKLQELQASQKANSSTAIANFLASVTLDHALPPSPPLAPRRFVWTDASMVWLTSLLWGEIYVKHMTPLGIWNATNVRLFYVKHTPAQQRQLTEAVSNVVGGILGRSNSETSLSRQPM